MAETLAKQDTNAKPSLLDHPLRVRWWLPVLALLLALPPVAALLGAEFYVGLATRIVIFALAATSLNLVLGFGGMVSFGHAAFVGVGAYTVAILMQQGVVSAWVTWPAAVAGAAFVSLVVGAISLRTRGVYFIMITLAFAQMGFYLMQSLKRYGGDDGISLSARATVGGGVDLTNDTHFYYATAVLAALAFVGVQRLLNARFGHVLQGIRENESRMQAIGFAVYRYKLAAFTLAGALAGLAGALLANQGGFVSPALMQWSQSGTLMVMVILGGVGHLWGGVVGAVALLLLEEVLSAYTMHWQFALGAILLAVVLRAPNGLLSLVRRQR